MPKKQDDVVNVSIRIRGKLHETDITSCLRIISNEPPVVLVLDKSQTYHFDNIFTEEQNQEIVYLETVQPLVEQVKTGYNCTVFAYGQTGTGKSYTIGTNPEIKNFENEGLIVRALRDFFLPDSEDQLTEISISFIEIYNEKVFDLLSDDPKLPLLVKGFNAQGFTKVPIKNIDDALFNLDIGGRKRRTGETKQNAKSSRSHAIFTIYYKSFSSNEELVTKLNLVDLAGLESVRKTGNQGSSFLEGIHINKGLLSLGQVMMALSSGSSHIPYRQSMITTILQDSLNKRNFISLIACVSSNVRDAGETLHTLEFAARVKKMRNKPEVNHIVSSYKKENPSLFSNMRQATPLKQLNNFYDTPFKKPKNTFSILQPLDPLNYLQNDSNLSNISTISTQSTMPVNFSPVIKKYMKQMEDNLMDKLATVIQTTIQRPSRRSSRLNKENATPNLQWNKLRKEMEDLVRTEIIKSTIPLTRATSSPINNEPLIPRKLFSPDELSPKDKTAILEITNNHNDTQLEDQSITIFKKPKPLKTSRAGVRKSLRLQTKEDKNLSELTVNSLMTSIRSSSRKNAGKKEKKQISKFSPIGSKKKIKGSSQLVAHSKEVLHLLNTGSEKDIQKLHTVGPKAAHTIVFFRKLKGPFQTINDLAEMPQWSKPTYERFLVQNFLTN